MTEEHKRKIGEANKGNKNCLGKKNALGYKHTEKWKKQNSIRHKGKLVSEVAKKKMSDYWKKYPNKNMLGKKHSIETRQKMSAAKKGENNSQWKGGTTSERNKIYNSSGWRLWRLSVFERDNFTCKLCARIGGYLEAHHIKTFVKYPNLRFEISNGITLCKDCHNLIKRKEEKFENILYNVLQ